MTDVDYSVPRADCPICGAYLYHPSPVERNAFSLRHRLACSAPPVVETTEARLYRGLTQGIQGRVHLVCRYHQEDIDVPGETAEALAFVRNHRSCVGLVAA